MSLFTPEWWTELAIQVLVAVLTTIVGMLTYDRAVARPQRQRLREQLERHLDRPF